MVLQNKIMVKILGSKKDVAREWEGGSSATPFLNFAAHFAEQNTKFGGG